MERLKCIAICGALALFSLPAACNGQFPTPTLSTPQSCADLDCGDGTCVLLDGSTTECMCPPGLNGRNCSVELNSCDSDPCLNGATCRDAGMDEQNSLMSGFTCFCSDGYSGLMCEIELICRNQCLNGGTCVEDSDAQPPSCQCPNDFTGSFCEVPILISGE